jgi:hypothetical protein
MLRIWMCFARPHRAPQNVWAGLTSAKSRQSKQADLALYTLDELRFSGAGDLIAALVLCRAHSANRVMIGGEWRVIDGVPVDIDVERLRFEHGEAARAFL